MDAWTILTLLFSFCMAFALGSNDAANALGTSYGTKALPVWVIFACGGTAEFLGAMFLSSKVATTLKNNIINDLDELDIFVKQRMMFAICVASFIFIMTSSISGMPISGTHTAVGAMLGAGIVGSSAANLNWNKVGLIFASWFFSPLFSATLAGTLMCCVSAFTLNTKYYSFRARILFLQLIIGACIAALTYILDKFFNRTLGYVENEDRLSGKAQSVRNTFGMSNATYILILEIIGFLIGVIICRLTVVIICLTR